MRPRWGFLLLVLALTVPLPGAASEPLRLGYVAGPDHATVGLVLRRWAQRLAFEPDGGVAVAVAAEPATTASLVRAVTDGAVDVAWLPLADLIADAHPLQLLELPLRGRPGEVTGRASSGLLVDTQWREAGAFTLLLAVGEAPVWLHGRAPFVGGGLTGLRVVAPTPALTDWVERLGGAPVRPADATADAVLLSWGALALRPGDGLTDHVQLGAPPERAVALAPTLAARLWVLAMRRDRLARLPEPTRRALRADAEVAARAGRAFDQVDRLAREEALGRGQIVHRLDPAGLPGWREAAEAVATDLLARLTAQGHDAPALRRAAQVALARASAVRGEEAAARTRPPRQAGG